MAGRLFRTRTIGQCYYKLDGYNASFSARPDQALALWRRRLRHPLVAGAHPFKYFWLLFSGIAADCAVERQVLGPDVAIDIEVIDETNTRVDVKALLACTSGRTITLDLSGWSVSSRETNILARSTLRDRSGRLAFNVAMGGFHISGCLSMLDGRAVELDECRDMGVSLCLPVKLKTGSTKSCAMPQPISSAPLYNYMK